MANLSNFMLLTGADASISQTTSSVDIGFFQGYAVWGKVAASSSATGIIKIQGSNDASGADTNFVGLPSNWIDISNSSSSIQAGNDYLCNVQGAYYNWIRVIYTPTSGTGSISVSFNGKEFGG